MAEVKTQDDCVLLEQSWPPHEAIFFILPYLPVYELLAMSQVCKSLRDAIKNDILPWMNLSVSLPLCYQLTDDTLIEVASNGKGKIQVLTLINCANITDYGLLTVISSNPNIIEMHLLDCTKLTPEGVIKAAKLVKLRKLSINGIYLFQKEHIETLEQLMNTRIEDSERKIFYHEYMKLSTLGNIYTDRRIDVDICPQCEEVEWFSIAVEIHVVLHAGDVSSAFIDV